MTIQFSSDVRDARANVVETTIGTSMIVKIRTGAQPANCAAADSGTVLATVNCPSDYLGASSGGVKSLIGTWADASADASGTAGHWRAYDSGGTVCKMQGSCSGIGGGGDMTIDNPILVATQPFNILTFGWTEGNA